MDLEIVLACCVPLIIGTIILVMIIKDKRDSKKKVK
jgi:hypothetical protein